MKVSREAQLAVNEWMSQSAQEAAEAAAEQQEIVVVGYETLERDFEVEKQSVREEISAQARKNCWDADQWLKAMIGTYRFTEDELTDEYQSRLLDDRSYEDALYDLYDPYDYPYVYDPSD